MNDANNMITDWSKLEHEFMGTFSVSYATFSQKQGFAEPNEELISKWTKQTLDRFNKIEPIECVIIFFNIPKEYNNTIKLRHYNVECVDTKIDSTAKTILFRLKLRTMPRTDVE